MFCMHCGTKIVKNAKFCASCGASLQAAASFDTVMPTPSIAQPATPTSDAIVAQVRPWVRYWARMFDNSLAGIVLAFAYLVAIPGILNEPIFSILIVPSQLLIWAVLESLLLATTGTTPGKWLFKTRVVPGSGTRLDYATALSRSLKVWWRGLGAGFNIIYLITMVIAYRHLTREGITTWDRDHGLQIVHERIGPVRIVASIFFFVSVLLVVLLLGATIMPTDSADTAGAAARSSAPSSPLPAGSGNDGPIAVGGLAEGMIGKMGVALGGRGLRVSEEAPHDLQR